MGRKKQERKAGPRGPGREAVPNAPAPAGGLKPKRRSSPEERRQAVEAYERSGLSLTTFARQWGVSHVTLGKWVRCYRQAGPKGLERLTPGPAKRRGKAPLPAALKAEVEQAGRAHPTFGVKRLTAWLWRFVGVGVSPSSVRRVVKEKGLPRPAAPRRRRRKPAPAAPRRFERARPGDLWQTDITYLSVPWRRGPLYLIVFLDDFSRFVVGHGLFSHMRQEIALETFEAAVARFGRPRKVLSDQGRQYYAWRGKSAFQRLLLRHGVAHVVARAQHPQTVGKCERLWGTIKAELWDRVSPKDLEEARARLGHYFAHYNFERPHQSLAGLVPADRFFEAQSPVRAAIEQTVEKNALRLALGQAPRRPVYLTGQIDGRPVSVHGESGRIVVRTPDGAVTEIKAQDLGMGPGSRADQEVNDESVQSQGARGPALEPGGEPALEPAAAQPAAPGAPGCEPGPPPAAAPAPEPQAHALSGAGPDAGAGAGAVAGGPAGGPGAGPPHGDGGAPGLAGQGEP